jgi:hypothetical protein
MWEYKAKKSRTVEDRTILRMIKLLNHDILSFDFCNFSKIYYSSLHISMRSTIVA